MMTETRPPVQAPTAARLAHIVERLSCLLDTTPAPACLRQPGMRQAVTQVRDAAAVAWLRLKVREQWRC